MQRTIAFLIFPDFQILDAAGPLGAFELPMRSVSPTPYALKVIAKQPGAVASSSGALMMAESFEAAGPIDTLVIAGGAGARGPGMCEETLEFVRRTAKTARRTASVCSGAYVLAAAGLLEGRRATTHWSRAEHFARTYPNVRLQPDRIFVRDGEIWTSAGITAGIDLVLALVADDLGEAVARRTAQQLVVYRRRPGGQSQFSALLQLEKADGQFSGLLAWAREHLAEPLGVERLAGEVAMSPRNFSRAFTAETGVSPARAVERLRLEAARAQIESSAASVEQIASAVGFGDPERMRRAFVRAFGQPPQALRRASRSTL